MSRKLIRRSLLLIVMCVAIALCPAGFSQTLSCPSGSITGLVKDTTGPRCRVPRLSNTTIDGVIVPGPDPQVRQVDIDTVPADLVGSMAINKTLPAN